jgi:hypothetical protein
VNSKKYPIFGLFFAKKELLVLDRDFRRLFPSIPEIPHKDIDKLSRLWDYFEFIEAQKSNLPELQNSPLLITIFTNLRHLS